MLAKMFMFEWRYFTRQPSFYISASIFFMLAISATNMQNLLNDLGSNVHINGPFFIAKVMSMFGLFAMILVVNFMSNSALRDHESDMAEILYCKPINALMYQLGRFLATFVVIVVIFSAVPIGLFVGSLMPWVAPERLGSTNIAYYLTTFFYISVPALFVTSCLFYAIATRLKAMMPIYLSLIAVFALYNASGTFFLSNPALGSLMDPFAISTFQEISRYWTLYEQNNQMLTLTDSLLLNRLLWLILSSIILIAIGKILSPLTIHNKKSAKKKTKNQHIILEDTTVSHHIINYKGANNPEWSQFFARTKFEFKQVIITPAFIALCGFVFLTMIAVLFQPKGMFGSTQLPFTQIMVQVIKGSMVILSMIIITYYSAEVIWRERLSGMGDIIDSMPVNNLCFWLSKLIAVCSILIILMILAICVTITYQLANGINLIDIPQYLISLFYFSVLPWIMLTILAFFLQVISPNKYIGMLLFALCIGINFAMEPLGLGHNMFRFSKSPILQYTDLNGFGWSLQSHSWYMLYWGALAIILSIIGYGLWQRGPVQSLKTRLPKVSYQITHTGRYAIAICSIIFLLSGSTIFYNTRVVNEYTTMQEKDEIKANYEKRYQQYIDSPVPTITKLQVNVDLYPDSRAVKVDAKINLINKTNEPINRFLISLPYYTPKSFNITIDGGKLADWDKDTNTYWFEFNLPLQPGEKRSGSFQLERQHQGFVDNNAGSANVEIVGNGTFFEGYAIFPLYGYVPSLELISPAKRKKYALEPPRRAHKLENSSYYNVSSKGVDIGYIDFEATVSTAADQIAIAPGSLIKQWEENGRRYFNYKSDEPIQNFVAFMSARYEKHSSVHNGVDIEIYYHHDHSVNVSRMSQAVKDALDYFSTSFGAYPHDQIRIIEFPSYRNFAQSFPNTIAFSERLGFITDLRDENSIDQIYYVIAHEVAHQWWGNQVDAADVQGSAMITETLSQYSALMLFKQKYGDVKLRKILKMELDSYLRGRSSEQVEELPLMRVENQKYLHYHKGSIVMMALVDLIGEERLNHALSRFVQRYKFTDNIYPTTQNLLEFITKNATENEKTEIKRLFTEVNIYDIKTTDVLIKPIKNNQFQVTITVEAKRLIADGQGVEKQAPLSAMVDIGLFLSNPEDITNSGTSQEDGNILYLKKHRIKDGKNIITLIVSKKPLFAAVDPFVKLIDRDSNDNIFKL
ncbi:MAG: hypothetical protein HRT54_02965 [Colwellia sp.]|nr:hypothetical protein [Colwellia sp.]